ncbi:hypothetical protein NMG29_03640 [Streptomyces cocklensis]|jgi:hypothetical protein|uniref:Integral membrane protein n=1 Tax=Actinacidiphila cocklensis TaxID=887465 RepID=A0A9W4E4S1_9ACTN|nr:hypothetical protein [Actinacidiphila cocklensis]MDD1057323.1 hypothetical protein [Actinacidiphila cocklensis]CAG6399397.1 conserved membrane hypothetical protein [Actinacidiphila cocklensis]
MYGPGIAPPQPRPAGRAGVIWLRVLFTALPVLSLGFLAWGSLLRLAIVRRNPLDWALMVLDIVTIIVGYTLVGMAHDNTDSWQSNAGTLTVLVCMFGTPAYYLVMDIRRKDTPPAGYAMPTGYPPNPYATGYGPMPGPVHPGPAHGGIPRPAPMQTRPPMPSQTPMPTPVPTPMPAQTSAPAQPPVQRMDQVRAELDELSDYLRKEEGR